METDFVKVTRYDLLAIFRKWNQQCDEAGSWDQPADAEAQADHFMQLANEHLNRVASTAIENAGH